MAEVDSAQSTKIAAGTKLSTNEQGVVKQVTITTPATFAQLAIDDTMATGIFIPKGARILSAHKNHGTGTASSTMNVGLRARDGTVLDATAICSVTALTTATTTPVECGNGTYIAAGVDTTVSEDAEVYITAKGAVLAANQDVRLTIFYTAG
jgi:hypothetical protein